MSYLNQPLGTIISSVLNYDQLCVEIGRENPIIDNSRSTYVPCDGRRILGSTLEMHTRVGPTQPDPNRHLEFSPDLRGKFMRGLNLMYSPGNPNGFDASVNGDTEADRMVNSYQGDAFKEHNHGYFKFNDGKIGDMSDDQDHRRASYGDNVQSVTNSAGDGFQETRPRNIAVYFYIKIN